MNPYHYLKPAHDRAIAELQSAPQSDSIGVLMVKHDDSRRVSDMAPI